MVEHDASRAGEAGEVGKPGTNVANFVIVMRIMIRRDDK